MLGSNPLHINQAPVSRNIDPIIVSQIQTVIMMAASVSLSQEYSQPILIHLFFVPVAMEIDNQDNNTKFQKDNQALDKLIGHNPP